MTSSPKRSAFVQLRAKFLPGIGIVVAAVLAAAPVAAAEFSYFVSMRAPAVDPAPRYVTASRDPVDGKTASIAGCDGQTYYLTPGDAGAVAAALSNANTVQLQVARPGRSAADSSVVCLMQASN